MKNLKKISFAEVLETVNIPSDPKARADILAVIRDISDLYTQIAAFKETVKAQIDGLSEKHELPKKYVRKLAKAYHQQTFEKEKQENEDFSILYETIVHA